MYRRHARELAQARELLAQITWASAADAAAIYADQRDTLRVWAARY